MKRFIILVLSLLLVLSGCGLKQNSQADDNSSYTSEISMDDCYLCGSGADNMISSYQGQNNVALISLNTFEIKPIEINRYDKVDGHLLEEVTGVVSFVGGASQDGGFSANLLLEYDRGFAIGTMDLCNDETLDLNKVSDFLCADCLNEILPRQIDRCYGVGVINFATKEIRVFEETLSSFGLGDFYIECYQLDGDNGSSKMHLLIFFCPVRYENDPSL